MRRAALALALLACRAAPPAGPALADLPTSPAGVDRAVIEEETETIEGLSERACACRDQACAAAVDADIAAYDRVATLNDPLDDVETWPSDLDAIARASERRRRACDAMLGFQSTAYLVLVERRLDVLAHDACACTDVTCARKALARFQEILPRTGGADETAHAAMVHAGGEIQRCTRAVVQDQAVLDLKAIRKDACACADAACAQQVGQRLDAWIADYRTDRVDDTTAGGMREEIAAASGCLTAARSQ